ncbi:MAG TPA: MMPL family transporter [Bacteroidia bacterium]|nr:MMPL family transporter [Bacteroidia bacterium]HRG52051.1 MMPL family transporter [Bacteroidia bacterium]
MWKFTANLILKNKISFIVFLSVITSFMIYETSKITLSYDFARVLPIDDPTYDEYVTFKKRFGEDGNVMVIGFQDTRLFSQDVFNDWSNLNKEVKSINGIKDVLSISSLYNLYRNDSLNKFDFKPISPKSSYTQTELDSIKSLIYALPFYEGLVYNKETNATVMAITFDAKILNSADRIQIVKDILIITEKFAQNHQVKLHYSGMPYIRSYVMKRVSGEMGLFLALAVLVTAIILWIFFKSLSSVLFSLLISAVGVVWSLGIMQLFGYKITILSGLIPPLIIVIGIPNCVFFINKYHSEYIIHKDKMKALSRMIVTMGVTLFLANITTAIGFGVLYYTNSPMLVEFGVVAAIGVMLTFLVSLIGVPIILSYLPPPKEKHTDHLQAKRINKLLKKIDYWVQFKRPAIYTTVTIITIIGFWGMTQLNVLGYVVDDLPKNDPVYEDLHFFEKNFNGVLPFEISIDSKKDGGILAENGAALYKINRLQKVFATYPEFSKPLSIAEGVKFSYQAYRGGNPKYYKVPGATDLKSLSEYAGTLSGQGNKLQFFIDSSKRYTRVSFQMADIGSIRIKELVNELKPRIDSIFPASDYNLVLTGHSLVFLKSNDYLLKNLYESLTLEIILETLVCLLLFRSLRIIILSKVPVLIPLVITAGIMGFMDINFKPSTILIFSIAFGISSDGTIYFLTRYRQELRVQGRSVAQAISITIRETGLSMIYTNSILFSGFAIFAASSFGGTVAMGVLVSLTLLVAMCSNLVLLPCILLSIDKRISRKTIIEEPFIEMPPQEELADQ